MDTGARVLTINVQNNEEKREDGVDDQNHFTDGRHSRFLEAHTSETGVRCSCGVFYIRNIRRQGT